MDEPLIVLLVSCIDSKYNKYLEYFCIFGSLLNPTSPAVHTFISAVDNFDPSYLGLYHDGCSYLLSLK